MLVLPLLFAGICRANPGALIISDGAPFGTETTAVGNLTTALQAAGYTVTNLNSVPGTILPATYKQVWDLRFVDSEQLSGTDVTSYVNYLAAGGRLVVIGENVTSSPNRDLSIASLVSSAGGGTITPIVNASNIESVLPPFTTTPDSVTSITFNVAGGSASTGTGSFIDKDTSPADGIGTGIVWPLGTLSNATLGILIAVFDVDFVNNTGDASSVAYLANLVGYMNQPAPFITSLTPSSGPVGTSVAIAGGNFGATKSTSTVTFNGTPVTSVTSWSSTSITAIVPAGATTGNVVVTVGGELSNGVPFTVTASPVVPTLSEGALVLLAGCLMAIAVWRLRRRQRPSAVI
jgi:hypothetical protein